jgi:hypothetical protein
VWPHALKATKTAKVLEAECASTAAVAPVDGFFTVAEDSLKNAEKIRTASSSDAPREGSVVAVHINGQIDIAFSEQGTTFVIQCLLHTAEGELMAIDAGSRVQVNEWSMRSTSTGGCDDIVVLVEHNEIAEMVSLPFKYDGACFVRVGIDDGNGLRHVLAASVARQFGLDCVSVVIKQVVGGRLVALRTDSDLEAALLPFAIPIASAAAEEIARTSRPLSRNSSIPATNRVSSTAELSSVEQLRKSRSDPNTADIAVLPTAPKAPPLIKPWPRRGTSVSPLIFDATYQTTADGISRSSTPIDSRGALRNQATSPLQNTSSNTGSDGSRPPTPTFNPGSRAHSSTPIVRNSSTSKLPAAAEATTVYTGRLHVAVWGKPPIDVPCESEMVKLLASLCLTCHRQELQNLHGVSHRVDPEIELLVSPSTLKSQRRLSMHRIFITKNDF